jgi:hypothetical protein
MKLKTSSVIFASLAAIIGISGAGLWLSSETSEDNTRDWTIIRQLDNRDVVTTTVVEIKPELVQERSVYDAAVKTLCSSRAHGNICIIGFFLPGDETPTTGGLVRWGDFKPLAVWWGNDATGSKEFTVWDCSRAGVQGSPSQALCGVGVKEADIAALALGSRQGIGEFCNWPPRSDIPATLSVLLSDMEKDGRSDLIKAAYTKMVESGRSIGRNEHYDCNAMRTKIDAMLDYAVVKYRAAIEKR